MAFAVLFLAALWAGVQNALAGGGSFVTLPALMFTGMDAQAANITSTIALFPAQIATALTGRALVSGAAGARFRALVFISLAGGALGAALLLVTPARYFAQLVPWLVLFATIVFAWGSFAPKRESRGQLSRYGAMGAQFGIALYGGYFGGGIGFLMLAALTAAGLAMRNAGATKNALAGVMNASAVLIFIFSPQVRWLQAGIAGAGALAGGILGGLLLHKLNERVLRVGIVLIGIALTLGLFIRAR